MKNTYIYIYHHHHHHHHHRQIHRDVLIITYPSIFGWLFWDDSFVFADFHPTFEPHIDPVARIILQEANHHDHHSTSEHHLSSVKRSPFNGFNVLVECITFIIYICTYIYIYTHIHYTYLWECYWHEQLSFVGHIPICCCPISLVIRGWWHVPLEHPQPKGKSLPAAILSWC